MPENKEQLNNRDEIMKFNHFNIIQYLNKIHVTDDKFLIDTQKHNLNKYKKGLDEYLHKIFKEKANSMIPMLITYQKIQENYEITETYSKLSELKTNILEENDNTISKEKQDLLKSKFCYFEQEMSQYETGSRFLIYDGFFNKKDTYVLVTNDLTFIGDLNKNNKKFKLKHCLGNKIIEIQKSDENRVILEINNQKIILNGDVQDFTEALEEVNFEYKNSLSLKSNVDKDLVKYYVVTNQYKNLKNYLKNYEKIELEVENFNITTFKELKLILETTKNKNDVLIKFIKTVFRKYLKKIDKLKSIEVVITEVFDILVDFTKSVEDLYKNLAHLLNPFLIEELIMIGFELIEKRIFNKFNQLWSPLYYSASHLSHHACLRVRGAISGSKAWGKGLTNTHTLVRRQHTTSTKAKNIPANWNTAMENAFEVPHH